MTGSFAEFKEIERSLNYSKSPKLNQVHIGLVQLSTDHSLERDWAMIKGKQANLFSTRVHYSSEMSSSHLKEIASGIEEASDLIAVGLDMNVMAFGCTSASLVIGEERVSKLLTKNRGNIPATNPWTAAIKAFEHLKAKKIGIFSPYPSKINSLLYSELSQLGFHIPILVSLGIEHDTDITKVSKESMEESLKEITQNSDLDLIFMSCTNLRILEHIQEFEEKFNLPIICSNGAMFWHAMQLTGQKANCPGYGKLLNL